MSYSVYIHTNKINGKRYVGVTTDRPERRWKKGEGYKNQHHFYSAIQKYGWDNFDHFIIEVDTPELMYQLEQQYIEYYHTTDPDKGYNKSLGGESGAYLGKDSFSKEYSLRQSKEYYESHKNEYKEYYTVHKKEILSKQKEYYEKNKEKLKERSRRYKAIHKEEIRIREKKYRMLHKEEHNERSRRWRYVHKYKDIQPITPLW